MTVRKSSETVFLVRDPAPLPDGHTEASSGVAVYYYPYLWRCEVHGQAVGTTTAECEHVAETREWLQANFDAANLTTFQRISHALARIDRSCAWLARQLNMDPAQLSKTLRGLDGYRMHLQLQQNISERLGLPRQSLFGYIDEGGVHG